MSEKIIIEREVPITQYERNFTPFNISMLTRDQLRSIARRFDIPRGQNKYNTVNNLYQYRAKIDPEKIKISVTIEID